MLAEYPILQDVEHLQRCSELTDTLMTEYTVSHKYIVQKA